MRTAGVRRNPLFVRILTKRELAARLEFPVDIGTDLPDGEANISPPIPAGRAVPIINRVAAGYPEHFTDLDYPPSVADEYVRCPGVDDPQAFAARVVGDSMAPKYREGDVVVFAPNAPVRDGDDCFVRFAEDNSTTFKRFFLQADGRIRLEPLNRDYPVEIYDPQEITGLWPAVMRVEMLR